MTDSERSPQRGRDPLELEKPAPAEVPSWAEQLVRWTDTAIRIPGTDLTIGLDPILGFFLPGAGDVVTAISAFSLFTLAVRLRVPRVVLLKMLLNVAIDALVGAVPFLGDAFDIVWRSNKRNLTLIERYRAAPGAKARPGDYLFVGLVLLALLLLLALPLIVAAILLSALFGALG